ncbi:DUF3349 domain-containing protein [Mycobacterium sp. shizuoka-1]|nr:DUF3349 domain-containing protein [Mycobacterium sp. shizuoka-1]
MKHRLVAWFRKDYPQAAPARGHCPLIALCGERTDTKR